MSRLMISAGIWVLLAGCGRDPAAPPPESKVAAVPPSAPAPAAPVPAAPAAPDAAAPSGLRTGLADFHALAFQSSFAATVRIGSPARVEITGDTALFDSVTTTVDNGLLTVAMKPGTYNNVHLGVDIVVPTLNALTTGGSVSVTVTGLDSPTLEVALAGSSSVSLAGKAAATRYLVEGSVVVHAKDLASNDVAIVAEGSTSMEVTAKQRAHVTVSGAGTVDIYGSPPNVVKDVTGSASVHVR